MYPTKRRVAISTLLTLLAIQSSSSAADKTWLAAVSGDWTDASKWDAGVPTASDNAIIDVTGTYTVTVKGNQAAANLTIGGGVTLRIEGAVSDATLTVTNGFTNPGTIQLTNSSLNRGANLVVTNGTLTNTNTIDVLSGVGTTITLRTLNCQLDNQGALNIGDDTALNKAGAAAHVNSGTIDISGGDLTMTLSSDTFTNTNTINIGGGRKLDVSAGTFNQNAGSISGSGTLAFSGGTIANFQTSLTNAVTGLTMINTTFNSLSGATLTNANALTLQGDTINGPFTNQGVLTVKSFNTIGSAAGTFDHQAGAKITITGDPGLGDASLTVTNGFSNPGTIELTNSSINRGATLAVTNGTLTNTNVINVLQGAGTTITLRTLNCQLDNQATLNIGDDATLSKAGAAAHTNSGTIDITGGTLFMTLSSDTFTNSNAINIAATRKLDVSGGTFNQNAGSIGGSGTLAFSGAIANFQTSFSNAVTGLTMTQTTFNGLGGATLTNANALTLQNDTINGPFTNQGVLTVKSLSNTIGSAAGTFVHQSGAVISIVGESSDSQLTVTHGFTNPGTIELTNSSNNRGATLVVTNGTLTNTNTIDVLSGAGTTIMLRILNCRLDNQGTLNIGDDTALTRPAVTHLNSGDVNLKTTMSLASGAHFLQSAGGNLNLTLAGTGASEFGRLSLQNGNATLDGALGIAIDEEHYTPVNGHAFEVVSTTGTGSRVGEFDAINGQQINASQEMQVCYGPKSVRLTVVPLGTAFGACDINCNGTVNPFDIQPFLDLLSGAITPCGQCVGDTDGNGTINPFDIQGFIDCLAP